MPYDLDRYLFAALFGLLLIAAAVLVLKPYRLLARRPAEARFWQAAASGYIRGQASELFTTLHAGGLTSLEVTVTSTSLIVRPFFPFTLDSFYGRFQVDRRIPLSAVRRLTRRCNLAGFGEVVLVDFDREKKAQMRMVLALREPEAFAEAVGKPLERE